MTAGEGDAGLLTAGGSRAIPPARRLVRWLLSVTVLSLVTYAVVAALPEIREGLAALRDGRPALLGLALVFEAGTVAALPQVYRAALRAVGGRLGYGRMIRISMGAFTLSRALPGGGPAAAVFAARRLTGHGVDGTLATAAVLITGVLSFLTVTLLAAAGAMLSALTGRAPGWLAAAGGVGVALLLAALVCAWQMLRSAGFRERLFRLANPLLRRFGDQTHWRRSVDELASSPPQLADLAAVVGWSSVAWSCEIGVLWTVFLAFGLSLPLGILVLGWGVANLITGLPHTPGGLGLVETGMSGVYVLLGVSASTSIIAVLAYRLFCYWLPMLAGIPFSVRGRQTVREPHRPDRPSPSA